MGYRCDWYFEGNIAIFNSSRSKLPWQRVAEVPAIFVGTLTSGFSERRAQAFSSTLEQLETREGWGKRQIDFFSTALLVLGSFLVLSAIQIRCN